jgi:hypothetical protein
MLKFLDKGSMTNCVKSFASVNENSYHMVTIPYWLFDEIYGEI